jgi:hypothetical protein
MTYLLTDGLPGGGAKFREVLNDPHRSIHPRSVLGTGLIETF